MTNIVLAAWSLCIGFIPLSEVAINDVSLSQPNAIYQVAGFSFNVLDFVRLYTTIEIRETKAYYIYFDPYRADFLIGGELMFRGFALGATHECNHDIVTAQDLHEYNGWDAAIAHIYLSWSKEFQVHPNVRITPLFSLVVKPYDSVSIKRTTGGFAYFFARPLEYSSWYLLAGKAGLAFDFFNMIGIHAEFQPEYSPLAARWSSIRLDAGLELRYRNVALGLDYANRFNLEAADGLALSELRIYLQLRGKSPLF